MISHTGRVHQFLFPGLVWQMNSPGIFLTFDDGPHPSATPAVLKILQAKKIKATFFVTGAAAAQFPSIVREIADEGHSIGIHAYTHTRKIAFSKNETIREILLTEEEIKRTTPGAAKIFRPPFGFFSWNTISAARSMNYRIIMWTTMTGDFRRNWSDTKVIATALSKLDAGSILVFHDNELTKSRISSVLLQTIKESIDRGFTFEAIL